MTSLVRFTVVVCVVLAVGVACSDDSSTEAGGVPDKLHDGSAGGGGPSGGSRTTATGASASITGGSRGAGGSRVSTGGATATSGAGGSTTDSGSGGVTAKGGSGGAPAADASLDARVADVSVGDSSEAGPTDAAPDAPPFCRTDASSTEPHPWSPPNICSSTAMCNSPFPNPCMPSHCSTIGGLCIRPQALLDGTPCDDGDPRSIAYPVASGCPPSRCIDGPSSGALCTTNADCVGAAAKNFACAKNWPGTYCAGGKESGNHCRLVCVGGLFAGYPCQVDTDCSDPGIDGATGSCPDVPESTDCPPAGRCVRWEADPQTGACVGSTDNPFCNTVADCPTTKYCASDPEGESGGSSSCYDDSTDDCCPGGANLGPCLVWDSCDTVNHVCKRTHQDGRTTQCGGTRYTYGDAPCVGGNAGFVGTTCNDVCRAGRCSHGFAACAP